MKQITMAHGTGGTSTHELIEKLFKKIFAAAGLASVPPDDAAHFNVGSTDLLITTDTHVVDPIIFPGGNIGKLAITGVVNDLLTRGGRPRFISLGFILEEGLLISTLETVVQSLASTMKSCGIELLCADTKVVPTRAPSPGMMITSTLIGESLRPGLCFDGPKPGDQVLVTGPLGSHGLSILQAREGLPFRTVIESDCTPLLDLLAPILIETNSIHYMRDPTRGGVSGILHELSRQFQVSFELQETQAGVGPTLPPVRAGLEILGLDPLDVANEGIMVVFVNSPDAKNVLNRLRQHPLGHHAECIGTVVPQNAHAVILKTAMGGHRAIPWPEGLSLPRIC